VTNVELVGGSALGRVCGSVAQIFVADRGGAPMRPVAAAEAVPGRGLAGDRYGERRGSGTGWDECQVTVIAGEHLDEAATEFGVRVHGGEHRRNLVVRGVRLADLKERTFGVGEAVLRYDRPRPPCRYIGSLGQPAMSRALVGRGGICARVVAGGRIRVGDPVRLLDEAGEEASGGG
jgi:MOSC domain-containing protein YiiM